MMPLRRSSFLAVLLFASPLLAAERLPIRAAAPGELITTPGTEKKAEIVGFSADLAPLLLSVEPEETVTVADWPVAPDRRAEVRLTRREVYAPDAKIFVVEGKGQREVPRSRRVFLWGPASGEDDTRVLVSIDPSDSTIRGFSLTAEGIHELRPMESTAQGSRRHMVAPPDVFLDDAQAEAVETQAKCDQEQSALPEFVQQMMAEETAQETADLGVATAAITSLHTATIAVETDNELMSLKFGNNTTTATNYLAELFAAMNVIYERDVLIRLVQGTTFLRPSTTADPYTTTVAHSTVDKLNEFTSYWSANHNNVTRALSMMLSGKQLSTNSSSGVAWVSTLCSKTHGYSFTQVFKFSGSTAAHDVLVVAHELGHNFGSPHTHCYSPPVDTCYNGEGGCYAGARSCPGSQTINGVPNVTGTLMSYCHLSGLAGCSSSRVFHPTSIALLASRINARVGSCIFPASLPSPPPIVTAVNPKSGTTAGGTLVTLTGTGFQAGATVTFGGTQGTSVSVVSPTRITVRTPAKATGKVAVVVMNHPSGQSTTLNDGFFYAPPAALSDFYTLNPCRVIDTRSTHAPALSASQVRTFTIGGACGVPMGARAVVVNVTTVTPGAPGFLQMFPGNAFPLGTSTINFTPGKNRANNALLMLSTDGAARLGVQNSAAGSTHLVLDVSGYFL
ncbi:MAG TPA: M12 family metallo-peptidase [Thermoanaerobaculia bacterium]|nr:M12 family metallo-peptidase [Thermoanaerobaculia bacterium]